MATRKCKSCRMSIGSTAKAIADLRAAPAKSREVAEEYANADSARGFERDPFQVGALEASITHAVSRLSGYCSTGCDPSRLPGHPSRWSNPASDVKPVKTDSGCRVHPKGHRWTGGPGFRECFYCGAPELVEAHA